MAHKTKRFRIWALAQFNALFYGSDHSGRKKEARRHSQERTHLRALFRTGKPIDELLLAGYWSFSRTASVVVTHES